MFKFERCPFLVHVFCAYSHTLPRLIDMLNAVIDHVNSFATKCGVCAIIPMLKKPYDETDRKKISCMIASKQEPLYSIYYANVILLLSVAMSIITLTNLGLAMMRSLVLFAYPLYLTVYNFDVVGQKELWLSYWLVLIAYDKLRALLFESSYWTDVTEMCFFYVAVRYTCVKHLIAAVVEFLNRNKDNTFEQTYRDFIVFMRTCINTFCAKASSIR